MLIVREALGGVDRYKDFSNALAISDHTLSRRLSHLQDIGVLQRDDLAPARYHLTPAGADLARVLAVLGDWAMHWLPVEPPPRALLVGGLERPTGQRCGKRVDETIVVRVSPLRSDQPSGGPGLPSTP